MAKMTRERAVKERREKKHEKKLAKKQALSEVPAERGDDEADRDDASPSGPHAGRDADGESSSV